MIVVNNLFFEVSGIIFILFLFVIYFSKKRLLSIGNNIYIKLIISNIFVLLFDIFSITSILNFGLDSLLSAILSKIYLVSISAWLFILTTYIFIISFKKMERLPKNEKMSFNHVIKRSIPLWLLSAVGIFILPIKIINDINVIYFDGLSVYLLYAIIIVCIVSWILRYIRRIKYIRRAKSGVVLFASMIMLISVIIQIVYPEFLLIGFTIYFITFTLYFFIDNPDLNLISELENAKKQVEEATVSKTDSLLRVSHEIRTPLNAIIGFSQSILEGSCDNVLEDVKYIKVASENLLNVVNNILDVTDVDMQKYKLIYRDYNVEMLIKQIVGLVKSKIEDKKIELNVKIEDNVPEMLCGDSIRIKQIVRSVLDNAAKYTKVGDIDLNVGCITIGNTCRLIINVKDTGIGISEDRLESLFDKKIGEVKKLTEGDVNLDLATIKEILKSMNGGITVESEYREGTTVTLVVDQKIVSVSNTSLDNAKSEKHDFSGKRILIVDDDNINLKVASRLLKNYKAIVEEVSNGLDCIDKIKNGEHFDLIFLDDWMPKMSGIETLKQLDEIKDFNTPLVALTANATSDMRDKYIKEGFNDYIPKPIERKELDRVIHKYLND
jgi:signal transduction histidine kinase/CheY-like chemotaxis protein